MEGFGLKSLGALLRVVACMLCFCFLVAIVSSSSSSSLSSSSSPLSSSSEKNFVPTLKGRLLDLGLKDPNPFREVKRKVPNGPDPIHNRRAGKSGQSPDRQ